MRITCDQDELYFYPNRFHRRRRLIGCILYVLKRQQYWNADDILSVFCFFCFSSRLSNTDMEDLTGI